MTGAVNAARKTRNGGIELLRFVFCLSVLCLHGGLGFRGGYLGVEFFFLISGAFMAKALEKRQEEYRIEPFQMACQASMSHLLKRVGAIFPYFVISTLIGAVVKMLGKHQIDSIAGAAADMMFLQNYGFPVTSSTGIVWYLSSMFFAMWVLYPIMRRWHNVYTRYFAPMVFLLLTGFLMHTYGKLEVPCEWYGMLNTGFMRAVAGMSLGAVAYVASAYLARLLSGSVRLRFAATVLEVLIWIGIVGYMAVWRAELSALDGLVVIAMGVAASVALSGQSVLSGKLDNSVTAMLGKASIVLFMNHYYWFAYLGSILSDLGVNLISSTVKILAVVLSVATSAIVWFSGNWLKEKLTQLGCWARTKLGNTTADE